jgi:hypothetical protein
LAQPNPTRDKSKSGKTMINDARFMTIQQSFGIVSRDEAGPICGDRWVASDQAEGDGTRAATLGLGPDWRRLKKAATVLAVLLALALLLRPDRLYWAAGLVIYLLWAVEKLNTHTALYRVLLNPEDKLWYVIGNDNLEEERWTWIPCSDGFATQTEAMLAAREARQKHDW